MWWSLFTIVDLYIGLVVVEAMKSSLPSSKLKRLQIARRVILGLIAVCGIILVIQIAHRNGWLRP